MIDPINPCRVPPGYRILEKTEESQPGDIYWHDIHTKWYPLRDVFGITPHILNSTVARKIEDQYEICST